MITNGIHSNVVNSVRNLSNSHAPTGKMNTTKSFSFADALATVQSQGISASQEISTSDEISAEDAKYLEAVLLPDGSMIYFPPNNAPIAAKKAWIEASKKMTNFQRSVAIADIIFPTDASCLDDEMFIKQMKERALGVKSYQDIFRKFKQEMEKKLNGVSDPAGKKTCQEVVQAWDILLSTFSKYNVE